MFANVTHYIYPEREQTRFCLNTEEREIGSTVPETQRLHRESKVKHAGWQTWLTRLEGVGKSYRDEIGVGAWS